MNKLFGFFFSSVFMMALVAPLAHADTQIKGSVSTEAQNKTLNQVLLNIPSDDPAANALELNNKLIEMDLPTIDVESKEFKMDPVQQSGITGRSLVGAQFSDGNYRFCLPCSPSRNTFEFGIIALGGEKKNGGLDEASLDDKKRVNELFGDCKYDPYQTDVSRISLRTKPPIEISLCRMEAACVRFDDGKTEITTVRASCPALRGKCPRDPVDCMVARNPYTVKRGESAIEFEAIPKRSASSVEKNAK